jgi:hypothetical protein
MIHVTLPSSRSATSGIASSSEPSRNSESPISDQKWACGGTRLPWSDM